MEMKPDLIYAEAARRRARKTQALALGEAEQDMLLMQDEAATPPAPSLPVRSPAVKVPRAPRAAARAAPPAAASGPVGAVLSRVPAPAPAAPAARRVAKGTAPAGARATTTRRAGVSAAAGKRPPARTRQQAALNEVPDLFPKMHCATPCNCPECGGELARAVCLGATVRACRKCKGVWFPFAAVEDFAREHQVFREVEAMIRVANQGCLEKVGLNLPQ